MTTYEQNLKTLARCQARYDRMEPPEYWADDRDDEWEEMDDDGIDPGYEGCLKDRCEDDERD